MANTDVTVDSSPTPVEDSFYPPPKQTGVPGPPPDKDKSAAPAKAEAAPTETASDPGETTEEEPKAARQTRNWVALRTKADKAEARAELLEKQLNEARAGSLPAKPEAKPAPTGKPRSEDFDTHDEYLDARDQWNRAEWQREIAEKQTQAEHAKAIEAAKAQSAKHLESWNAREAIVEAKHDNYDADFASFMKVAEGNQVLATAVYESELGPDLAQFLGATPDELKRISGLEARALVRAIGRLEERLTAAEKGSEKPITKAPRPLADVGGAAARADKPLAIEELFYK